LLLPLIPRQNKESMAECGCQGKARFGPLKTTLAEIKET